MHGLLLTRFGPGIGSEAWARDSMCCDPQQHDPLTHFIPHRQSWPESPARSARDNVDATAC